MFPQNTLRDLLDVMKERWAWSPYPGRRATVAHNAPKNADLRPYVREIADELLWWGSNDVRLDFGGRLARWRTIVRGVASNAGIKAAELDGLPTWRIEQTLLKRVLTRWEKLTPAERQKILKEAGVGFDAARGGMAAAGGGAVAAAEALAAFGGPRLLAFLGARIAPMALAGPAAPFIAPVLTVLGGAWAAYDLAGPAFRVVRPATLLVAVSRQNLRDARISASFED